jgi:hypothetical protein
MAKSFYPSVAATAAPKPDIHGLPSSSVHPYIMISAEFTAK